MTAQAGFPTAKITVFELICIHNQITHIQLLLSKNIKHQISNNCCAGSCVYLSSSLLCMFEYFHVLRDFI